MSNKLSKRILIVDDDRLLCQALKIAFSFDSHVTECVQDAESALKKLEHASFDVVLTDLVLPGLSGAQLADTIKGRQMCKLVGLMSGFAEESPSTSVDFFVHKPFKLDSIRQRITDIFSTPAPQCA